MGFVKIAHVDTLEEAHEIWSNFLDLSERSQEQRVCKVPEKIENGSRLFLADGQSFVLFMGDKFVDTVSGPGIFVYLDVFAGGYCENEQMRRHAEILKDMKPDAFLDEIPEGELPEGFLFMCQESKPITFTFDEASYYDCERKMDVMLQGSGYFVLREANLRVNYALADFSKEKLLERMLPEFSEEEKKQFALEVENSFEKTFAQVSSITHFSYERLPYISRIVTSLVNGEMYDAWVLGKGIILKEIQFRAFYPAETCLSALVQFEKTRKAERERNQVVKAQEEARAAEQAQQQAQQAAQAQISASNQQATSQTQQSASNQQTIFGNGADGQEYIVKTGNCNWAKSSVEVQLGKATLTNKRFIYTMGKLGTLGNALLSNITGSDKNFEFFLSDIAEVREAKQGVAPSILFMLKNGRQYKCTFTKTMGVAWNTAEWLTQIRLVMKANGLQ